MRVIWGVVAVVWAGAALAEDVIVRKEGNTTYVTTVGNLAPTRDPGCVPFLEADSKLSPADLFLGVIHCIKEYELSNAVVLDWLMLARARFDTRRVTDKTAHGAGRALQMMLGKSLLPENVAAFDRAMRPVSDPKKRFFFVICDGLRKSGVPDHDPGYMISHGMGAITGKSDRPLVADFDAAASWEAVLKEDFLCKG